MKAWSSKQSYIALGSMLETAALLGVDTCAMEGFDSKAVDEILGLTELGLESVAFLPVGYRSETDATADYKKVRLEKSDFLIVK
jgi:nitroreductase